MFKVGDKVKCVDATDSVPRLDRGRVYIVRDTREYPFGSYIHVNDVLAEYRVNRFVLANEQPVTPANATRKTRKTVKFKDVPFGQQFWHLDVYGPYLQVYLDTNIDDKEGSTYVLVVDENCVSRWDHNDEPVQIEVDELTFGDLKPGERFTNPNGDTVFVKLDTTEIPIHDDSGGYATDPDDGQVIRFNNDKEITRA
jgi:hypothetical protein